MKKQLIVISTLLIGFTVFALPHYIQAGNYPVRSIKGVVPYGAGGSTDVVFRAIVADAKKYLGKPIAVVNMKGGGGSIAGNYVAKASPDGYTILLGPTSVVNIYPTLTSEPAYTLGDLIPVCVVTVDPRVFVVRSDARWNTLKSLAEDAKKSPGTIRFATSGLTSWSAFGIWALQAEYPGIKFVGVPLRGGPTIVASMLRGDVDVSSATFANFKAQVDVGKLKVIAIASETRSEFLPDVSTCKEQGIKMPMAPNVRYVWVNRGTPVEVQKKLEKGFKAMCESPTVVKRIRTLNQNLEFHTQEEAMEIAKEENAHFKKLIEQFGLKKQFGSKKKKKK